ncbi:MAG: hypothetical protein A2383_00750 [Candidatus Pacebacteria bacterium RIFOXYB1_FULL_39_46]|nr:MAG: hypothetical protein A2182_00585 [Candidatus Pacebacteria bacterium RIFOXYA1_FULL_38_18]OGJ38184.1 MAG: hypothetical protein A2383_00750 [Candidatus Pacebacteria bacterium RIFOXYB1_FULL_39_46]OGJ39765.1 MAG: hypothetical protein A2411_02690 [Candidatus Pacebacteria bacterium RIFOXYC1_FULL_39_21]OGJ40035.1 MAG: hypothetical protein A2582_00515 [Candidatus Pacebacteria bacterium RIFOXYD1_FULL_39_27]
MDFDKLKIAVVHDCYLYLGGAERVLENILKLFPQAEVYIALIKKPYWKKLSRTHTIHTSLLNKIPLPEKYISFLKPLVIAYWERLKLDQYDLVISSSHSFSAKSVKTKFSTLHLAYLHTPPRYLYREFNEMNWVKKPFFQKIFSGWLTYLRKKDWQAAQRVDQLIANSQTTQKRIAKYYDRKSLVIYPPAILPKTTELSKRSAAQPQYYLFHSRLVKQKGAELVIKTFNRLNKPLIVIGTGAEKKYLQKIAGPNISFVGFVTDQQLIKLYGQARALIYTAIEEDFGLVPVEAMSCGVPVIAFASGGVKETVVHKKTGLLFDRFSIKSLERAIKEFEKNTWSAQNCRRQAAKFSEQKFQQQLLQIIQAQFAKKSSLE